MIGLKIDPLGQLSQLYINYFFFHSLLRLAASGGLVENVQYNWKKVNYIIYLVYQFFVFLFKYMYFYFYQLKKIKQQDSK